MGRAWPCLAASRAYVMAVLNLAQQSQLSSTLIVLGTDCQRLSLRSVTILNMKQK